MQIMTVAWKNVHICGSNPSGYLYSDLVFSPFYFQSSPAPHPHHQHSSAETFIPPASIPVIQGVLTSPFPPLLWGSPVLLLRSSRHKLSGMLAANTVRYLTPCSLCHHPRVPVACTLNCRDLLPH